MPGQGTEQRKLAAIMFTDMVGYSALAQKNEELALKLLDEHRRLLRPLFPKHGGQEVKTIGDAFLVEFMSALDAVRCAIEMQKVLTEYNASSPETIKIQIRIGIHVGDVVHRENDVFGDGVNIAARIEPLAPPGGICLTQQVFDQVHNKLQEPLVKLGQGELKHIQVPVRIYRVALPWEQRTSPALQRLEFSLAKKRTRVVLAVLVLAAAGVGFWQLGQRWALQGQSPAATTAAAQGFYERGMEYLATRTETNLTTAIKYFKQAIDLDPKFAKAYAQLATAYNVRATQHAPNQGWDEKAFEAAQMAVRLDPELPEALAVRAELYFTPFRFWDAPRAIVDLQKAIRLDPQLSEGHSKLAYIYSHWGFLDETLEEIDKALAINQSSGFVRILRANTLVSQGDYDQAMTLFELIPDGYYSHPRNRGAWIGICLIYQKRYEEAAAHLERFLKENREDALLTSVQAILFAATGQRAKAEKQIQTTLKGERGYIHFHHALYHLAGACALLGENQRALALLKKSAEKGFPCYPCFDKDPHLENLRNDPQFKTFMVDLKHRWEVDKEQLLHK